MESPLPLPHPPKKQTIHNLPKTSPHQISHHQCDDPGIDPIVSPHPWIQCNGPLQKDPHPEPGSDRVLTSSRTLISSPPVIEQHRTGTTTVTWPTQEVTYVIPGSMDQDFRSLTPVRVLTLPSIPVPFHWCEEKCPEVSSEKSWNFFSFQLTLLIYWFDLLVRVWFVFIVLVYFVYIIYLSGTWWVIHFIVLPTFVLSIVFCEFFFNPWFSPFFIQLSINTHIQTVNEHTYI